jgi:rhamnosyltransferase
MKTAAVVILYHPTIDAISNIKTYYDRVDKIFVYDNTETGCSIKDELLKLSRVDLFENFKNEGIPKNLNDACRLALQQGYEWILTMDQDSNFSAEIIQSYFECFNKYPGKENVAMFGINRSREKKVITNACTATKVQELITSGSVINLSCFKKIGEFDEALFIDLVDSEFCARAKIKGYEIIQFSNIYLVHQLGKLVNTASIKSLFLIKKKKEVHSALRCYYMYRNMLYLIEKYKNIDPVFTKKLKRDVLGRIRINLYYGGERQNILKYIKAAEEDFKNNKMGEYQRDL